MDSNQLLRQYFYYIKNFSNFVLRPPQKGRSHPSMPAAMVTKTKNIANTNSPSNENLVERNLLSKKDNKDSSPLKNSDLQSSQEIFVEEDKKSYKQKISQVNNLHSLKILATNCTSCDLCNGRLNVVFGRGFHQAKVMFIGEAPGSEEDKQKIPFVGRAGKLLAKMILSLGLTMESVYITNVVKCRPHKNRNPAPEEIAACAPFLNKQIELINPQLIVVVGAVAMSCLLPQCTSITKARGQVFNIDNRKYIAIYHPAYLLRHRSALSEAYKDMQLISEQLHSY